MISILQDKTAATNFLSKDLYVNLNAINFLKNNGESLAYVYNNDIENGVIVTGKEGEIIFLATHNLQFLMDFWDTLPQGHQFFSGVPSDIADIFLKNREPEWASPCKVYAAVGEFMPSENDKYICESLQPTDAEEVDKYYTYRDEGTVEVIRNDIINMDSACVRINGELACWCLVHSNDGSLGPLYTKEKFRRQGLAEVVSSHLIEKLINKKMTPYVQIVQDNMLSLGLITKFGYMEFTHDCTWFGVVKEY
ncbi:MAG: GNAT family N-acetyltransferase [Defluviitaleaceae bacterium]|nr:GNAT family N-acetyltransferase [Defluviitaleaceae bacterium]